MWCHPKNEEETDSTLIGKWCPTNEVEKVVEDVEEELMEVEEVTEVSEVATEEVVVEGEVDNEEDDKERGEVAEAEKGEEKVEIEGTS